jgi:hypothetical protein
MIHGRWAKNLVIQAFPLGLVRAAVSAGWSKLNFKRTTAYL